MANITNDEPHIVRVKILELTQTMLLGSRKSSDTIILLKLKLQ